MVDQEAYLVLRLQLLHAIVDAVLLAAYRHAAGARPAGGRTAVARRSGRAESIPIDDLQYVRDLGLVHRDKPVRIAPIRSTGKCPRELTATTEEFLHHEPVWYIENGVLQVDKLLEHAPNRQRVVIECKLLHGPGAERTPWTRPDARLLWTAAASGKVTAWCSTVPPASRGKTSSSAARRALPAY